MIQLGQSTQQPTAPVFAGPIFPFNDSALNRELVAPANRWPGLGLKINESLIFQGRPAIPGMGLQMPAKPSLAAGESLESGRTARFSAHSPRIAPANVSTSAESFAREHGLWGSLIVLKNLILRYTGLVASIEIDLVSDPEVAGWNTICFCIRTNADLPEVLTFDEQLQNQVRSSIPTSDQIYFAVRFDFE